MIYTSYFARLKDLPDDIVPISICGKAPDWYTGLQYKALAPNYDSFVRWKWNRDDDIFASSYHELVLGKLDADNVVTDLAMLAYELNGGENDICLICYERPSKFCHRHLVADWLNRNGIKCEEYVF